MKRVIGSVAVFLFIGALGAVVLGACRPGSSEGTGGARGEVHVDVTDKGFEPSDVKVPAGQAVTLVMTRKTDQTCATEVVFPSLNQRYPLPLNKPVRIALPSSAGGTLRYQCGMNMLRGQITVQ